MEKQVSMNAGNRLVVIVGSQCAFNELLARHITDSTGAASNICENINSIDLSSQPVCLQPLVLHECPTTKGYGIQNMRTALEQEPKRSATLALFNVEKESQMEAGAIAHGVKGFFYKDDTSETFVRGVRALFAGEPWIPRQLMMNCLMGWLASRNNGKQQKPSCLTDREIEILSRVATGADNQCIAKDLCISQNTVKTHLSRIFRKIEVKDRLNAVLWGTRNLPGLSIEPADSPQATHSQPSGVPS